MGHLKASLTRTGFARAACFRPSASFIHPAIYRHSFSTGTWQFRRPGKDMPIAPRLPSSNRSQSLSTGTQAANPFDSGVGPTPQPPGSDDGDTFKLPDSRSLGYAIRGASTGPSVFYFGSMIPSSRLEVSDHHETCSRLGIRIIGVDRPGWGLSSPSPNYSLLDWPNDVQALAAHLNIEQFYVLGALTGSAYAFACAYALPKHMLKGTGVWEGMAPVQYGSEGMSNYQLIHRRRGRFLPAWWLMRRAEKSLTMLGRYSGSENWEKDSMQNLLLKSPEKLRKPMMADGQGLQGAMREAFRYGAAGYVSDMKNVCAKWRFDLRDIQSKVHIWHSDTSGKQLPSKEPSVSEMIYEPVEGARWMAERLPNAILEVGEFCMEKVLKDLIALR